MCAGPQRPGGGGQPRRGAGPLALLHVGRRSRPPAPRHPQAHPQLHQLQGERRWQRVLRVRCPGWCGTPSPACALPVDGMCGSLAGEAACPAALPASLPRLRSCAHTHPCLQTATADKAKLIASGFCNEHEALELGKPPVGGRAWGCRWGCCCIGGWFSKQRVPAEASMHRSTGEHRARAAPRGSRQGAALVQGASASASAF